MYEHCKPEAAKKIYVTLARKAEKNKLWAIAARLYGDAGKSKKSRQMWKKLAEQVRKDKGPEILIREADEKLKPEPKKHKIPRKFVNNAVMLERTGKFSESKKEWLKVAKFWENECDFKKAAYFYHRAGTLKDANRVWKLNKQSKE